MSRYINNATPLDFGAFLQTSVAAPLDSRDVVENYNDLGLEVTWGGSNGYVRVYPGLRAYVNADKKVYMYIGPDNKLTNVSAKDSGNKFTNWVVVADSSSNITNIQTEIDELSGKSVTAVEDTDSIDLTINDNTDGTKKVKGDLKVVAKATGGNKARAIDITTNGVDSNVSYDATTNTLTFADGDIKLNGGISDLSGTYATSTEKLTISYKDANGASKSFEIDLSSLASEYSGSTAVTDATDTAHNTNVKITNNVDGKSIIEAEIDTFDCGEF